MDDFKKSEVVTFDDELQALIDYGHDCCARIDDQIHECCERIRKAHDVEVGVYEIALGWKQEQEQLATTYDVLGNERHKAVCELKRLRFSYEGTDFSDVLPPEIRVGDVCNLIGAFSKLQDDWPSTLATARDTLIYLLGGDANGMDTAGCGVCGCAGADVSAAGRVGDSSNRADNQGQVLTPITQELRKFLHDENENADERWLTFDAKWDSINRFFDAIDAAHANLERENEELHQRTMYPAESERINMLEREVKRLAAECKTQRNNFDQATSAREHWKSLYEQSLEHIHDLERDYKVACDVNERQDREYNDLANRYDNTISLPFDKDGKVWRIGDELLDDGIPCEVVGIGPNRLYYYFDMTDTVEWTQADGRRHYERKPNVESVLVELLREYDRDDSELTDGEIVERFAARLRLAGDDE